jgi:hypothetical protein
VYAAMYRRELQQAEEAAGEHELAHLPEDLER